MTAVTNATNARNILATAKAVGITLESAIVDLKNKTTKGEKLARFTATLKVALFEYVRGSNPTQLGVAIGLCGISTQLTAAITNAQSLLVSKTFKTDGKKGSSFDRLDVEKQDVYFTSLFDAFTLVDTALVGYGVTATVTVEEQALKDAAKKVKQDDAFKHEALNRGYVLKDSGVPAETASNAIDVVKALIVSRMLERTEWLELSALMTQFEPLAVSPITTGEITPFKTVSDITITA